MSEDVYNKRQPYRKECRDEPVENGMRKSIVNSVRRT